MDDYTIPDWLGVAIQWYKEWQAGPIEHLYIPAEVVSGQFVEDYLRKWHLPPVYTVIADVWLVVVVKKKLLYPTYLQLKRANIPVNLPQKKKSFWQWLF